jgi:hypothetical protein
MVPDSVHDFFVASGPVAGALIGLLFVAVSVAARRLSDDKAGAQLHRVRAVGALTAFTNALAVSLLALIPGHKIALAAIYVAAFGLLFVAAALVSLIRVHQLRWTTLRDGLFLLALVVTFVVQLVEGSDILARPDNPAAVNTIALPVVVCFLIGIARSWELIGGPSMGFSNEVSALVRDRMRGRTLSSSRRRAVTGVRRPACTRAPRVARTR